MVKRQKWKGLEDKKLKDLILSEKGQIRWDVIALKMLEGGINKTSKQCRERWLHQLDPSVERKKWTKEDNKKLFKLHQEIGNKWKNISVQFPGRTDNAIKNNFFSLIRKSLRTACKVLGKISNTKMINIIKPKVLSDYITHQLKIDFTSFNNKLETDITNEKNNLPQSTDIKLNDFIQKFAFNKFAVIYSKINDRDIFVVKKCIEHLISLNDKYNNNPKIKTPKKNKESRIHKIKKFKKSYTSIEDTKSKLRRYEGEEKNSSESIIFEKTQIKKNIDPNKNSIQDYIEKLKNSLAKESYLRKKFRNEPLELKKKLILQFQEVKEYSEKLLERIWMATEEDLIKYSTETNLLNNNKKNNEEESNNFLKNFFTEKKVNMENSNINNPPNNLKKLANSYGRFSGFNSIVLGEPNKFIVEKNAQTNFNNIFSKENDQSVKLDPLINSNGNFIDPITGGEKIKPLVFNNDFLKAKFLPQFQEFTRD